MNFTGRSQGFFGQNRRYGHQTRNALALGAGWCSAPRGPARTPLRQTPPLPGLTLRVAFGPTADWQLHGANRQVDVQVDVGNCSRRLVMSICGVTSYASD